MDTTKAGMTERISLKKAEKNGKNGPDWPVEHRGAMWQYGWTHFGVEGQTEARFHPLTRAVEIKDGNEWVRCVTGAETFFTPGFLPS